MPQARPASYSVQVFTLQKALLTAGALCFPALAAGAQTSASPSPSATVSTWPATPPPSSVGIFPLESVRPGQHAVAYTVFQGNKPEPFGVDILGVLRDSQGPGEDLILARLTGPKAEYTGVVAGMSGSPVYLDGKLLGALAFRIGQFSKEPIAGITPIAEMLTVRDLPAGPSDRPGETDSALTPAEQASTSAGAALVKPMETPLVFSGFSPDSLELWKQHAPAGMATMVPEAGVGGAGTAAANDAEPPLEPGSSVSALLVAGDMEIAATCTVTYLSANHLLACGHPLSQFGAVSLPMTKSDVVATLASPAGSFKIVNTGATVGAFTQDRQTAIGGMLGETARMIPVAITMHEGTATGKVLHLRVLDQAGTTPTALLVSLFQALQETPAYQEESSYEVHAVVNLQGYAPVKLQTLATPGGFGTSALTAALTLGLQFNELYSSSERDAHFTGISIDVDALPGRRVSTLERVAVEEADIHAGDTVTVDATVHPYRGSPRTLRIPIRIPDALPQGDVRLLVSDGGSLDKLEAAGRPATEPLASVVRNLNAEHSDKDVYVSLLAPDTQLSLDGQTLAAVPVSVANLLLPAHEAERASLHSESAKILQATPLAPGEDMRLAGEQILTIRVE